MKVLPSVIAIMMDVNYCCQVDVNCCCEVDVNHWCEVDVNHCCEVDVSYCCEVPSKCASFTNICHRPATAGLVKLGEIINSELP